MGGVGLTFLDSYPATTCISVRRPQCDSTEYLNYDEKGLLFWHKYKHSPYNGNIFPKWDPESDPDKFFCSELVMHFLKECELAKTSIKPRSFWPGTVASGTKFTNALREGVSYTELTVLTKTPAQEEETAREWFGADSEQSGELEPDSNRSVC